MIPIERKGICKHCGELVSASMWRKLNRNGSETFCRICPVCHRYAPFGGSVWISKAEVYSRFDHQQRESFPVILSGSITPCVVCGSFDVELHHWAPKFKFKEEADNWPTDYLCTNCHTRWHKEITPKVTWS